jgi:hypothetical protein
MNDVPLREYVDQRFADIKEAVNKAEAAADNRFAAVNEMRAMMADSASRYVSRPEYSQAHKNVEDKIEALQKMMWIATGIVLSIQIVIGFAIALWKHL